MSSGERYAVPASGGAAPSSAVELAPIPPVGMEMRFRPSMKSRWEKCSGSFLLRFLIIGVPLLALLIAAGVAVPATVFRASACNGVRTLHPSEQAVCSPRPGFVSASVTSDPVNLTSSFLFASRPPLLGTFIETAQHNVTLVRAGELSAISFVLVAGSIVSFNVTCKERLATTIRLIVINAGNYSRFVEEGDQAGDWSAYVIMDESSTPAAWSGNFTAVGDEEVLFVVQSMGGWSSWVDWDFKVSHARFNLSAALDSCVKQSPCTFAISGPSLVVAELAVSASSPVSITMTQSPK